jgi:glycosyltransferase involved in cell wall biosynthesis
MRICRIVNVLPSDRNPGGGLVPYYLAKFIREPTLYITHELNGCWPLPSHVAVAEVGYPEATTPPKLRQAIFGSQSLSLFTRAGLQARLSAKMMWNESKFFTMAMRRIKRFQPDLVICGSLKRLIYGAAAKHLLGSKLILSLHNATEIAALSHLWLLRQLLRAPDLIIVVSAKMERELRPFVPDKRIHLSSTGVDLDQFTNWNVPRKKQLVSIGSFKWKKGYRYLLEAVALVFKRHPEYRLIIVGDGEERQEIAQTIERLGLSSHVTLAGIISREEIVRLLNESSLFVMASLHEGLPKVLLEAIACGTPAVVTDGCNAQDIIETTGVSVPAANPKALANGINTILEDQALWGKCSNNGPAVARRYDWKTVAARDYAVYCEVLCQGSDAKPH